MHDLSLLGMLADYKFLFWQKQFKISFIAPLDGTDFYACKPRNRQPCIIGF